MDGQQADNLPPQTTSFIGRSAELAELARLLADPQVRLLTICAPGGMGKTRLAVEVARRQATAFAEGAVFVPLQQIEAATDVPAAIAAALAIPLTGALDPLEQLLAALHDKHLLLVLDNVEQLGDGVTVFSRLLTAAPQLKLLVTSREPLLLQEEWRFPLEGLTVPDDPPAAVDAAALQLFAERARQARPDFSLVAERPAAVRICRLVAGMPLAIELAATWTRTLSCAAIAAEIARNLDFLASDLRNLPDRHRSLRVVCDQAWAMLNGHEQAVFAHLTVFRAGFTAEAAAAVAGARLADLDGLIARSLIRRTGADRYQIHELLRQYGAERLQEDPAAAAQAGGAAGAYYAHLLDDWFVRSGDQGLTEAALAAITPELENIRTLWPAVVAACAAPQLQRAMHLLHYIYFARGPYAEGVALLDQALAQLQDRPATPAWQATTAEGHNLQGWFRLRQGRIDLARAEFTASVELYAGLPGPLPIGDATDPFAGHAMVALIAGDYQAAVRLGLNVLERGHAEERRGNQAIGLYILVSAALAQGQYQVARRYADQLYALAVECNNRWFLAYCHIEMGHIAFGRGEYAAARPHYEAAYEIREAFADPEGMALALAAQGSAALAAAAPAEAGRLYERSLTIYRYLGDRGGLAAALDGLGRTQVALGQYAAARSSLLAGLQVTVDMGGVPLQLALLTSLAELLCTAGYAARGLALALVIAQHPAADRAAGQRAQALLAQAHVEPAVIDPGDLAGLVATLPAELAALSFNPAPDHPPAATAALVEPLSEREREILSLIAAGHSNQEIADTLVFSVGTVKWYTTQIYGKLGVKSRTQAVARARELGLIAS